MRLSSVIIANVLLVLLANVASGAKPRIDPRTDEVERLFRELGANQPQQREWAMERLNQLAEETRERIGLADATARQLQRADLSFDLRSQLSDLARRLPPPSQTPRVTLTPEEIDRLISQLEGRTNSTRTNAYKRLEAALDNPLMVGLIWPQLKERWSRTDADPILFRPLCDIARRKWVTSKPKEISLPPVDDAQLQQWLVEMASERPEGYTGTWAKAEVAWRELIDFSSRDEELDRLRTAITQREQNPDVREVALARLRMLAEWLRPAMVAEIWNNSHVSTTQYLIIGEPQMAPGALRPTFFDRADEKTVHCASGNSLASGDYVFGRANPPTHPESTSGNYGVLFHLLSQPTPRARLAYEYVAKESEAERLAEITRRTCAGWLAEKHVLTEREIMLLMELDGHEVSKFAGPYFQMAEDKIWRGDGLLRGNQLGNGMILMNRDMQRYRVLDVAETSSRHGMICMILAVHGDHHAIPGIVAAIDKQRFRETNKDNIFNLPWIAAVGLAAHDPWDGVNPFLASLVERKDRLIDESITDESVDVGAAAVWLLLQRHNLSQERFGLVPSHSLLAPTNNNPFADSDNVFRLTHCPAANFKSPASREQVLQWWKERAADLARRAKE